VEHIEVHADRPVEAGVDLARDGSVRLMDEIDMWLEPEVDSRVRETVESDRKLGLDPPADVDVHIRAEAGTVRRKGEAARVDGGPLTTRKLSADRRGRLPIDPKVTRDGTTGFEIDSNVQRSVEIDDDGDGVDEDDALQDGSCIRV